MRKISVEHVQTGQQVFCNQEALMSVGNELMPGEMKERSSIIGAAGTRALLPTRPLAFRIYLAVLC